MVKKRSKSVLVALREWAKENNIIDKVILKERFLQCIEEPDPVDSVRKVKDQMFNSFIASIRNKSGIRVAFPVKNEDGTTYIHIVPGTTDLKAVSRIDERLTRNTQGNDKTRKPVKKYKEKLIEQMSLSFITVNK